MLGAGALNKFIRIRRWQDEPDTGFGIEQTFDSGFNVWAKKTPVNSVIFLGSVQAQNVITDRFTVRRSPRVNEAEVTASHVIEYAGMRYRVKRVLAVDGDLVFVSIDTELLGAI